MENTEIRKLPPGHSQERLEALTPGDLEMLDRLVIDSHWNQLLADWRFFFDQGHLLVVRDSHSRIVASGAVLPMDADANGHRVAWISMILVLPQLRGQGLGRLVFEACLRCAQSADYLPMLDATPQGEPLYTQFGFVPLSHITRWRREDCSVRPSDASTLRDDLDALIALDTCALGFGRSALVHNLRGRPSTRVLRSQRGFALIRQGRTAQHIGPLLAEDEGHALELFRQATNSVGTPLLIDAPQNRRVFAAALEAAGFVPQRHFARMAWVPPGRSLPQGQSHFIYAIAGPEFA